MTSKIIAFLLAALFTLPAFAHVEGATEGFTSGLLHPFLGLDHLLAMFSVGLLSASMGKKEVWLYPSAFVAFMVVGGILGLNRFGIPLMEYGIGFSVLFLGVAFFVRGMIPSIANLLFIGFFGLYHGYAHGFEIPELASPVEFVAGFTVATIILHLLGVGVGLLNNRKPQGRDYRLAVFAGIMVVAGAFFVISALTAEA